MITRAVESVVTNTRNVSARSRSVDPTAPRRGRAWEYFSLSNSSRLPTNTVADGGNARDVPPGPGQVLNQPICNRSTRDMKNDGDRSGSILES